MIKLEINNAEYIAKLEEARLSADNPYGYLFMDIVFSDPRFDENTFEMKNVRREPMRTYMRMWLEICLRSWRGILEIVSK
ncbi:MULTISPECIES: hypothetical protein [Proteus]|uniref:hypothetical protein n=1 Tax=Proteus TaxID=583 RepID=UPI001F3CD297|nr:MULTISPECIES: hypothetical protein [Proteus]